MRVSERLSLFGELSVCETWDALAFVVCLISKLLVRDVNFGQVYTGVW